MTTETVDPLPAFMKQMSTPKRPPRRNVAEEEPASNGLQLIPMASDPVGYAEIADRLGVELKTVHQWNFRKVLPAPDYDSINGSQAWEWRTILYWAGTDGKIEEGSSAWASFRSVFGRDPITRRVGGTRAARDEVFLKRTIEEFAKRYGPGPWHVSNAGVTPMSEIDDKAVFDVVAAHARARGQAAAKARRRKTGG